MIDENYHELLAQVASLYYQEELTQNEIAAQLGLSRVKIYRLLKEAKAENVVQISVSWPLRRDRGLERDLKQLFRLDEALVLKTRGVASSAGRKLAQLGQLGARYLEQILSDGCTMAVCLGRTSYETIHAISPNFQARVRVAQAVGSMPQALQELDSAALAGELARKLGGEVLYLTSPLMGDSVEAAQVIRRQPDIQRTLDAARQAQVALTGIGNLDPAISGFYQAGFISAAELAGLTAAGAVGDIGGQIYTCDGQLFPCDYNRRIIGLTLDELKQIPTTIAVALGQAKAKAILGGLRTGAINVLCTDDEAAAAILTLQGA